MRFKSVMTAAVLGFILSAPSLVACEDDDLERVSAVAESTQAEIEAIRNRVLRRCGLSPKLAENKLPWYFFYEFGVELLNAGKAAEALEPLQMTANLKSEPARAARMYGMWYINYLPYFQMSLAYAQLEQWDQAWDAIVMSEALVEFSPGDYQYDDFESLKQTIARERQPTG
jgi:hypothetical protein